MVTRASGSWWIPKFPFTPPATFWDFLTGLARDFVSTLEISSVFVYGKNTLRNGFWHSFGVVTSAPGPFKIPKFWYRPTAIFWDFSKEVKPRLWSKSEIISFILCMVKIHWKWFLAMFLSGYKGTWNYSNLHGSQFGFFLKGCVSGMNHKISYF